MTENETACSHGTPSSRSSSSKRATWRSPSCIATRCRITSSGLFGPPPPLPHRDRRELEPPLDRQRARQRGHPGSGAGDDAGGDVGAVDPYAPPRHAAIPLARPLLGRQLPGIGDAEPRVEVRGVLAG